MLECEVEPNLREPEGPFSEFSGYYGGRAERAVLNVKGITMRKDAIYKAVQSAAFTPLISTPSDHVAPPSVDWLK